RLRALVDELRTLVASLEPRLANGLDQTERQLRQVRGAAERLRLSPAHALFAPLERTARDVARGVGKQVAFHAQGGDVRLDGHLIGVAQAALVQLVRNAVAHGIEAPSQRAQAGKPTAGRIDVEVIRRGNRVAFVCRDDGRGIDVAAVRQVAVAKGYLAASDPGGAVDDLFRLLLKGGISTVDRANENAGRGVGLDVVREAAAQLGGDVAVRSTPGVGTQIELTAPISLASIDALLVEGGGARAAIPLEAVRGTLRLEGASIVRGPSGASIVHEDQVIPFVSLASVLRAKGAPKNVTARRDSDRQTAVVVAVGELMAAIGVERSLGVSDVVVRPLPPSSLADPVVAGLCFDADGTPQLVLDPAPLVAGGRSFEEASVSPRARPPVLVIDDSLTTRMLEQSILESAGYQVALATSAEEGLEMARQRSYGLFLVDVEMPGMNGFDFVEKTRADPALRAVPAILVTSRDAEEDRRRGAAVGAHAYVVKGDFNQSHLLDIIRKLIE
ncbi:MAG TPA: response regulator, partial [Polyangia bacterium]|nr:response regulator [Polyangia bacterium]